MNAIPQIIELLQSVKPSIGSIKAEDVIADKLDSLDIVEIIARLETTFGVNIAPEAIVPENFETAAAIAVMLEEHCQ